MIEWRSFFGGGFIADGPRGSVQDFGLPGLEPAHAVRDITSLNATNLRWARAYCMTNMRLLVNSQEAPETVTRCSRCEEKIREELLERLGG